MVHEREFGARSRIKVRGTRDGLVIHFPEDPSPLELIQDLQDEIERAGKFFRHGELVINYGTRPPDQDEIGALLVLLRERDVRLRTVTAGTPEFRSLLHQWGFDQPRERDSATGEPHADQFPDPERRAFHIHDSVSSGTSIELSQDVVIHGDVDSGAEITTTGNVIVWGTLRGRVHAGSRGDQKAFVCALRLIPERLQIDRFTVHAPEDPDELPDSPMMAKIVDNAIVAVDWKSGR
jgi:septum site-determining protein MinC